MNELDDEIKPAEPGEFSFICKKTPTCFSVESMWDHFFTEGAFDLDIASESELVMIENAIKNTRMERIEHNMLHTILAERVRFKSRNQAEIFNRSGFVYVLNDLTFGYSKIGFAKDFDSRFKTLKTANPSIEPHYVFRAKMEDERILLNAFEPKKIRGEWFNLSEIDRKAIIAYSAKIRPPYKLTQKTN